MSQDISISMEEDRLNVAQLNCQKLQVGFVKQGAPEAVQQVLGMEELLSIIMANLPTSGIKSCNGVSRLWRQEARKILLKRTRMDFYGDSPGKLETEVESYMKEMGDDCHYSIKIHNFGESDAETAAIGEMGKKYGKKIQKLEMAILGNLEILESFSHVTTLTLGLDLMANTTGIFSIPQDLIMPNVKSLTVNATQFDLVEFSRRGVLPFPKFMIQDGSTHINYAKQFPGLKRLSINPGVGDVTKRSYVYSSFVLFDMLLPDGTLPCPSVTSVDTYIISKIEQHFANGQGTHRCCKKGSQVWKMLKNITNMFPGVVEFKKYLAFVRDA